MDRLYAKQMNKINRQEETFLNTREIPLIKEKLSPIMYKIQNKIPDQLSTTLETAFYKGFQIFYEKGNKYIEKTYNKENKQFEFEINDYAINKKFNNMSVKRLDKPSLYSNILNTSFSVLEGGVLGTLGIGLPDIPIFISLILKTTHENALSYGFDYTTEQEKAYELLLIQGALTKEDKQKEINQELDHLSDKMDHLRCVDVNLDDYVKSTSKVLSDTLLTAKFIQGIPIVGAVGGAVNFNVLQKIGSFSKLKYKKRYYLNKFGDQE